MPGLHEIKRPDAVDTKDPRFFKIHTAPLRAYRMRDDVVLDTKEAHKDGDKYYLEGIASSTVMDSYGDVLTEACQAKMLQRAKGMTMWLNHSYKVPEDVLGTNVEATLVRGTAGDGTGRDDGTYGGGEACTDLRICLEVDQTNPRAMKAWQQVNNGIKLGYSIGGWFLDVEIVENDAAPWGFGFIVNDIDLLEISLVGLPANPRSYTKSLEVISEKFSKYVLERAESIAKGATSTEATMRDHAAFAVKSMLQGAATAEDVPQKCAHVDGCDEVRAEDSLLCDKHGDVEQKEDVGGNAGEPGSGAASAPAQRDSDPASDDHPAPATHAMSDGRKGEDVYVDADTRSISLYQRDGNGYPIAVLFLNEDGTLQQRELSDMQAQACITAMTSIKSAIGHGMCTEAATHARTAHAVVKAILPNDYNIPDDAELGDEGGTLAVDVDALRSQLEAANATIAERDSQIEQMSAERTTLEQQVEQLKATPAGRQTRSTYSAGSSKSQPTADPSLYMRTHSDLMAAAARNINGAMDARTQMQRI